MRKSVAAESAAEIDPLPDNRADMPTRLVCLSLALALVMLCARIASIW